MNMKRLNKIILISLLPILYLIYSIWVLYTKFGQIKACDLIIDLQYIGLILFLELLFLYLFSIRKKILQEFLQNKDLAITFILIFIIKLMKFNLINIAIDIVYLLQIFISSLSEFIIIIPFMLLSSRYNFAKYLYKIMLLGILILNISSYFYFYNTSEALNPIIFDNVNIIALSAMIDTLSMSDYIISILLLIVFLYILIVKNSKVYTISYIVNFIKFGLIALILYTILFYLQQGVFSKGCQLYGYEKKSKNLIVDISSKNTLLDLTQSYLAYLKKDIEKKTTKNINKEYTESERNFLIDRGLLEEKNTKKVLDILKYDKVIFVTFESLSNDFINFYNEKIPKESTYFINHLLETYPHLNNFYSANMPTQEGLNAFTRSKFTFNNYYEDEQTLFSFFDDNQYYVSYLRGISKYYGGDQRKAKKYFRAKNIIAREELESKYGSNIASNWGVHVDTVYKEAVDIIKEHDKLFLFIKTVDFHHPGVYYGKIKYPKDIAKDPILKSLYWLNKSLEDFFLNLKKNNLFDDKTIIFITADHNPHSSFDLDAMMIDNNSEGLRKIPFIVVTKESLGNLNKIENKYSSQIDILPTFIAGSNDYIGKNLNFNKKDFYMTFYEDLFTYKNKDESLNFSLDVSKCIDILEEDNKASLEDKSICKLLYNTNNI